VKIPKKAASLYDCKIRTVQIAMNLLRLTSIWSSIIPGVQLQDQMIWPTTLQQEEPVYILIVDKFGVQQTINMYTVDTYSVQGVTQHAQSSEQGNLLTQKVNMTELSRR